MAVAVFMLPHRFNLILNSYLIMLLLDSFMVEWLYLRLGGNHLNARAAFLTSLMLLIYVIIMRFGAGAFGAGHEQIDPTIAFCARVPYRVIAVGAVGVVLVKAYLIHAYGLVAIMNAGVAAKAGTLSRSAQAMAMLADAPALGVLMITAVKIGIRPRDVWKLGLVVGPLLALTLVANQFQGQGARRSIMLLSLMAVLTFFYMRSFHIGARHVIGLLGVGILFYGASGYYQLVRGNMIQLEVTTKGHVMSLPLSELAVSLFTPSGEGSSGSGMETALEHNLATRAPSFGLMSDVLMATIQHPYKHFGGTVSLGELGMLVPGVLNRHKDMFESDYVIAGRFGQPVTDLATTPFEEAMADFGLAGLLLVPAVYLLAYAMSRWCMMWVSPRDWLLGLTLMSVTFSIAGSFEASIMTPLIGFRTLLIIWIITLPAWYIKQLLSPPWSSSRENNPDHSRPVNPASSSFGRAAGKAARAGA